MTYRKHFIPLESNPALFTALIHQLGVSTSLAFHDVLSIDNTDLLAFVPRPALALILVFPTSTFYEEHKSEAEISRDDYSKNGDDACGLYGILHAISNGDSRHFILPDSHLSRLLETCRPFNPLDRAQILEGDEKLESAYRMVALQGDSEVPANPEDDVDYHYVCFVKSHIDGHLYEMDGDRKGPVDRGPLSPFEDVLAERGLNVIREFIQREEGKDTNFSLLVLAPD